MPSRAKQTTTEPTPTIPADIERQLLSVEMLPVDDLFVDYAYQRDLDQARVNRMAREWNWLACRTLTVSLRQVEGQNKYSVIDGQQRMAAIKVAGYKKAPCTIYVDLSVEQEALLYEILNQAKKPGYNDLFKSRLMRGEQTARNIHNAVEQMGYHLDPERRHAGDKAKDSHFYIQTMAGLERIYNRGGVILIMDTLRLLRDMFAPEHLFQQQMIISGIATFLERYGNNAKLRKTELASKVRKEGQLKLTQRAFQWAAVHGSGQGGANVDSLGGRGNAFAEAMLALYNTNRQEANRIKSKA